MVEDTVEISPRMPKETPLVEDIVGQSRTFVEQIIRNIEGEFVYGDYGISPNKSFLLYGPPGTGKTLAIEALNNTINQDVVKKVSRKLSGELDEDISKDDFNLLTFEYNIGEMGTAYINMTSRRIHEFFTQTCVYSRFGLPVLLVFDEADALLSSRKSSVQTHSEDRKAMETIMKDMQIAHDSPRIYTILMSNYEEIMDSASLRAGRIDKRYKFHLPTIEERVLGFEKAIDNINLNAGRQVIRGYNSRVLAEMSEGFNYADIFQSVESAVRNRIDDMLKTGELTERRYIKQPTLEDSVKEHKLQFAQDKYQIGFK